MYSPEPWVANMNLEYVILGRKIYQRICYLQVSCYYSDAKSCFRSFASCDSEWCVLLCSLFFVKVGSHSSLQQIRQAPLGRRFFYGRPELLALKELTILINLN